MSSHKINANTRYALRQLMDQGGAVMTSCWTTGAGQHTRARTIPPFCAKIYRANANIYPKRIKRVFARHPRCKAVVAIVDMRSAKRVMHHNARLTQSAV